MPAKRVLRPPSALDVRLPKLRYSLRRISDILRHICDTNDVGNVSEMTDCPPRTLHYADATRQETGTAIGTFSCAYNVK